MGGSGCGLGVRRVWWVRVSRGSEGLGGFEKRNEKKEATNPLLQGLLVTRSPFSLILPPSTTKKQDPGRLVILSQ